MMRLSVISAAFALTCFLAARVEATDFTEEQLARQFSETIQPLVKTHCLGCHGTAKQEAKLSLAGYTSAAAVAKDHPVWELVRQRLTAGEMPPDEAPRELAEADRKALVAWIDALREFEAEKHAGDP